MTRKVSVKKEDVKIVTDIHGRPIRSLPKSQRVSARKAMEKQCDKKGKTVWKGSNVDPDEQRHLAHRVANSRTRGKPTRRDEKTRGIDESRT